MRKTGGKDGPRVRRTHSKGHESFRGAELVLGTWVTAGEDGLRRDVEEGPAVCKPGRTPEPLPRPSLDLHVVD